MRVIVVGSGLGGLLAALEAAEGGAEVLLVTKGALAEANTTHAQGGIAAALFPDDSVASHVADTLAAGAGLSDPAAVAVLCAEGPDRVRDLIARGVRFDHAGDGVHARATQPTAAPAQPSHVSDPTSQLARGLEAAHSTARVVHAGGDATGAEIERALIAALADEPRVTAREDTALVDLVLGDTGAVVGVELAGGALDGGRSIVEYADAVVLATGGAGQLFAYTTNPAVATGDGVAAAWRAGAELADAEFYQFHPTALAAPGSFLISEAVRGEGAVLRNARGDRFMLEAHPAAELAPRDVVARAIAWEMRTRSALDGEGPARHRAPGAEHDADERPDPGVYLDATGLGASVLARRFPTIDAATRAAGFDWAHEPIPVTPAAHYWMGGIATDSSGRTSLPGLWAVGECAATGAHGANRLASNSLLEAAVFAHRAVADALEYGEDAAPAGTHAQELRTRRADTWVGAREASGFSRGALQRLMWDCAGVQRSGEGLQHAASVLASWNATTLEDRNLLDVARVVVDFALAREESRGAHYRSDFPLPRPEFAQRRTRAREGAPVC